MLGLKRNFPISSGLNRLSVYPGLPTGIDGRRLIEDLICSSMAKICYPRSWVLRQFLDICRAK